MLPVVTKFKVDLKKSLIKSFVRFLPRLAKSIGNEVNRGSNHELVYAHLVATSDDPVRALNYLSEQLSFRPIEVWRLILLIQRVNDESFYEIARQRDALVSRELKLKLTLRLEALDKTVISARRFNELYEEYLEVLPETDFPDQLRMMVATLVVSRVQIENVQEALVRLRLNIGLLTEFQKVRLLSRFDASTNRGIFERLVDEVDASLSSSGRLKVELYKETVLGGDEQSYQRLEDEFCRMRSWVAKEYSARIKPLFSAIPSSQKFLSARFDKKVRKKLQKHIIDHVNFRKALSYVRLGDGECYGFPDPKYVDKDGIARQEKHWWGSRLESSLRTKLQLEFVESISQADMLGVPTVLRLIREFKLNKQDEYTTNSLICRLLCVMRTATELSSDSLIVEDQSNLYLFDVEFINDIFRIADRVVVVSGIDSELIQQWAPDRSKLTVLEVPTHRLLRGGELGNTVEGILPEVYEQYLGEISSHSGPGVVFLISAGFIGKIFVTAAARDGAVALDIGQSLVGAIRDKGGEA